MVVANSVRWYGHVLMMKDGDILRMALDFEVEGQKRKGRLKRTWKRQVEEESMKVGLRSKDALCHLHFFLAYADTPLCRSKWSVDVTKIAAGLR